MQIPQHIAGLSSNWSRSELRNAEGKSASSGGKAEGLREDQHVEFSQEAMRAMQQQSQGGKVEDGALHAGMQDSIPEVAICPECGSANCGCLARLEAQQKLDEARAQRDARKVNEIYTDKRVA